MSTRVRKPDDGEPCDVAIVGAGSAGCVLANRLSAEPSRRVVLIEAGGRDRSPLVHLPFGLAVIARQRRINWNYETAPQRHLDGRRLYWPRGKLLGGSSSVNAMCYVRGHPSDYDRWGEGWRWDDVLPEFRAQEANAWGANAPGPSGHHGADGPLSVESIAEPNPLSHAFVATAGALQMPRRADFNAGEQEGLGLYQVTQKRGLRHSAASAFLRPALDRPNLRVMTDAPVRRVAMDGARAVGVVLGDGAREGTVHAREVVLAGGAIGSPQLLMLSGIGPSDHLREHGIGVVADRPNVGANLIDHLDAIALARERGRLAYAIDPRAGPAMLRAAWGYARRRTGQLASNIAEAGGFARSRHAGDAPDIQLHFLPALLRDHGRRTAWGYGVSLHACALRPLSRGTIRLSSADPDEPPVIDPDYLAHERDMDVMEDALAHARRILSTPPLADHVRAEIEPGPGVEGREATREWIRANAQTIYHPMGTCRMGSDADSVVDLAGRVRGVEGLRVADASLIPEPLGGNTNAPTMMIAGRIAGMMVRG